MADNIVIKVIEKKPNGWKCLIDPWLDAYVAETVGSRVPVFTTDLGKSNLLAVLQKSYEKMSQQLMIAWDKENEKVAGFLWNQVLDRNADGQVPGFQGFDDWRGTDSEKQQVTTFLAFWDKLGDAANIFQRYNVKKGFYMICMRVLPEYHRRGIAKQLMSRSMDIAEELGCDIVFSNLTSKFTQRIGTFLGMEVVCKFTLRDHYEYYDNIPKHIADVHDDVVVMVKHLSIGFLKVDCTEILTL